MNTSDIESYNVVLIVYPSDNKVDKQFNFKEY